MARGKEREGLILRGINFTVSLVFTAKSKLRRPGGAHLTISTLLHPPVYSTSRAYA